MGVPQVPFFNAQDEVIGIVDATLEEGQNLNFAIPIDYAAGMLSARELQRISDFYEPDGENKEAEPATAAQPVTSPKEQPVAATPSASIKQDAFSYLSTKIGIRKSGRVKVV